MIGKKIEVKMMVGHEYIDRDIRFEACFNCTDTVLMLFCIIS